jgi:hypothetical protein
LRRTTTVLGVCAIAGLVIVLSRTAGPSSSSGVAGARSPVSAATVKRRNLVATDTETGALGYADPHDIFNRVSGTVTALPNVGQVIAPGHKLYRIDQAPVVLFSGGVPAYRDLVAGDTPGADLLELNRNLRNLGFDPEHLLEIDDVWQAATTRDVAAWQASLGEAKTGAISLGQVVFLPGPQRITAVNTVLGSTGGSSGTSAEPSSSSPSPTGSEDAQAIIQTTSTRRVVSVELEAGKQSEAGVGAPVTVQMPNGETTKGKIVTVSPVAQTTGTSAGSSTATGGSSGAPAATIRVTIALPASNPGSGLDQATVSVNFVRQEEQHVLSVPVTALLATAGGGYAIQVASSPHELVAVAPGLFAAGYVQIAGARVHPGLRVTDSQG